MAGMLGLAISSLQLLLGGTKFDVFTGGFTGRSIAKMVLPGLAEFGFSGADIIGAFRNFNLGYRKQDMYRDINEAKDRFRTREVWKSVSSDQTFPVDGMIRSWQMPTGTRYRISGFATFEDSVTGVQTERPYTMLSDDNLTEEELLEQWNETFTDIQLKYQTTMVAFERHYVTHNERMSQSSSL